MGTVRVLACRVLSYRVGLCEALPPEYTTSARIDCSSAACSMLLFNASNACAGSSTKRETARVDGSCVKAVVNGEVTSSRSKLVKTVAATLSALPPPMLVYYPDDHCSGPPAFAGGSACVRRTVSGATSEAAYLTSNITDKCARAPQHTSQSQREGGGGCFDLHVGSLGGRGTVQHVSEMSTRFDNTFR
jgi:hypothetical protein